MKEQKIIEEAAGTRVIVTPAVVKTPADLHGAFAALIASKPEVLLLTQTALFMSERRSILELASKYRIPVVGYRSEQADDGALMSSP